MKRVIIFIIILTLSQSIANSKPVDTNEIYLNNKSTNYAINNSISENATEISNENIYNRSYNNKSCDNASTKSCPCRKCIVKLVLPGLSSNTYFRHENVISALQKEASETRNSLDVICDCNIDKAEIEKEFLEVKKQGLENSLEGLLLQADLAMSKKEYKKAEDYYNKVLELEPANEDTKNKLAFCLRKQKRFKESEKIYLEIIQNNPDSIENEMNWGYLKMDEEKYEESIKKFQEILEKHEDYRPAKMGLIYSYAVNSQYFSALEMLNKMTGDEEVNTAKAYIYYTLGMYSDATKSLDGYINKDTINLANQIKKARAFTFNPSYNFLNQELTETYDLDIRKIGLSISQYGAKNLRAFIDYGLYVYISGNYKDNHLEDVTNEIKWGIEGRPTEKISFRSDLGLKVFQVRDSMITTDSLIKYYASDNLKFKLGFFRNNLEQSYLSAVGIPINGVFTGQVAVNKAYAEIEGNLPKQFYYILKVNGGAMTAQNLPVNAFIDTFAILGKNLYDNHDSPWIQHFGLELMSNNQSYQQNMFSIPGSDSTRKTIGGYFSPSFYNANTINFKLEGVKKEWRLRYGLKGFVGYQCVFSPDYNTLVYGVYPYVSYSVNDHVSVSMSYLYSNYATILKHFFMISIDIKMFNKVKVK